MSLIRLELLEVSAAPQLPLDAALRAPPSGNLFLACSTDGARTCGDAVL